MNRFWIRFSCNPTITMPPGTKLGCGVTAKDKSQALEIIKDRVFGGKELPEILSCIENIDIRELDSGHVLPNMGNPALLGVWFPLGYL